MPARSSKPSRPRDASQLAWQVVQEATGQAEPTANVNAGKNPAAVALGSLGGKKGGKARAEKLSPERRREIAKHAAEVRWQSDKEN